MFLMRDAYGLEYDRPAATDRPSKTLMLASIPRSGSTYCGLCMWQTGVLGVPLEYLNINTNRQIFARVSRGSQDLYWREVQRRRQTSNGLFSYKMFIANYLHFKKHQPDFLEAIAPQFVIYLTREDKLGQAISYVRAIQSRKWFAAVPEQEKPKYSFGAVRRQLRSIEKQEQAWENVFALTGTEPLRITYEQLLADQQGTLLKMCGHVGERIDDHRRIDVGTIDKQADEVSDEWRQLYLSELPARKARSEPSRAAAS